MSAKSQSKLQYVRNTFKVDPDDELIEDISCYYDKSLIQPAHLYCTKKLLCFHIHAAHGERIDLAVKWDDICNIEKKNVAKIIPNAIAVTLNDHKQHFFCFINRNHAFKTLHFLWKGRAHGSDCLHDHSHESETTYSSVHPDHPDYDKKKAQSEMQQSVDPGVVPTIRDIKIEDVYKFEKQLGTGAFSVVRLAKHKKNGVRYAVKIVDKVAVGNEKAEMLEREVDILRRIKHPHIVSVQEIYETDKWLYLVMELATGGELFDAIVKRGKYKEKDSARMVRQIVTAIHYLHEQGIVHRDLKPENLLLAHDGDDADVKLADFGLSKIMETSAMMQTACGTPGYVAPEVLKGEGYNQAVDVWSTGVIMYILLCGVPPFYASNNAQLFDKIMSGKYNFPSPHFDKVSESAKDLIRHMLVVDPKKRFTSEQVFNHPWIQGNTVSSADLHDVCQHLGKTQQRQDQFISPTSSVAKMAMKS